MSDIVAPLKVQGPRAPMPTRRGSRHLLTKAQNDRLVAKRRAYRASMRCVGVRVEVLSRTELFAHAKALVLWRAIKKRGAKVDCAACGDKTLAAAAPYFALCRCRPSWDAAGTWALGICQECVKSADLRAVITKSLNENFVRNYLSEQHVSKVVLPVELETRS